jgi:hypothetical protein
MLKNNGRVLSIGAENYPFPYPLMKNASGEWYFDSNSGSKKS